MERSSQLILASFIVFFCLTFCLANSPTNLCTEVGRPCNTNSECCKSCCSGTNGLCLESCAPNDNPCSLVRCRSGYKCELQRVDCLVAPCRPKANCVPVPKEKRNDGPCATVRCMKGHHCEVKQVFCIRAPCPGIPDCVPDVKEETNPCASTLCMSNTQCIVQPGAGNQPPQAICEPIPRPNNGGGHPGWQ